MHELRDKVKIWASGQGLINRENLARSSKVIMKGASGSPGAQLGAGNYHVIWPLASQGILINAYSSFNTVFIVLPTHEFLNVII